MPPETHLISTTTDYFAPPQVYVFLGIKMATFSWLLKPDSARRIDGLGKWSLGLEPDEVLRPLTPDLVVRHPGRELLNQEPAHVAAPESRVGPGRCSGRERCYRYTSAQTATGWSDSCRAGFTPAEDGAVTARRMIPVGSKTAAFDVATMQFSWCSGMEFGCRLVVDSRGRRPSSRVTAVSRTHHCSGAGR